MRKTYFVRVASLFVLLPTLTYADSWSVMLETVTPAGTTIYANVRASTANPLNEMDQLETDRLNRIYVLGGTGQHGGATTRDLAWLRFTPSGSLDAGFNGSGKKILTDLVPNAPFVDPMAFTVMTVFAETPLETRLRAEYMLVVSSTKISTGFNMVLSLHDLSDGS